MHLLNHLSIQQALVDLTAWQDLKEAQPSLGRGLQQLLDFEGDVEAAFQRTFQISYEVRLAVLRDREFYRAVSSAKHVPTLGVRQD